jgi:dicarboxylate transporter 10
VLYGTTRFAIYDKITEILKTDNVKPTLSVMAPAAAVGGFIGGLVGNSADLVNVRMQNDTSLPLAARRNYTNFFDGFVRMGREEGLSAYFRGIWPNAARAALISSCQLASYDAFKGFIIENSDLQDNTTTHLLASILASLVATTICSPVDVVKTQVMSRSDSKSVPQIFRDIYRVGGIISLFRGWVPSFIRTGPQTVATFLFLEQHRRIYRRFRAAEAPENLD